MLHTSLRSIARFALSAAVSWSLIPIAAAEAPDKSSTDPMKHLLTVPEDGMGDKEWLSGANRIVREIMAKRPDEDLVICVAGCVAPDRVVYAQPAEKKEEKAEAAAATDAAPASETAKAEGAKPEGPPLAKAKPAPEMPKADAAVTEPASGAAGEKPATAVNVPVPMNAAPDDKAAIEAKDQPTPGFVPTASEPVTETSKPDAPVGDKPAEPRPE